MDISGTMPIVPATSGVVQSAPGAATSANDLPTSEKPFVGNHRFKVGQLVYVQLHDWDPGEIPRFQSWRELGRIESLVHSPLGYNVTLKKRIIFKGNYPLPVGKTYDTDQIFVREGDAFFYQTNMVKEKLRAFISNLAFREVTAVYTKPTGQIQYINYYAPDGKVHVMTDDKKHMKETGRLAYKVGHFYGFSGPCQGPRYEKSSTAGIDLHFTMNRFSGISFWEGIEWEPIEKSKAFLLRTGNLICGTVSQTRESHAPSFDQWFTCSRQFKLLCFLLMTNNHEEILRMKRTEIIENLIIPENKENYYIPHEIPISRYLYAAIYLLVCCEEKLLPPPDWQLPQRRSPFGPEMERFEIWWPRKVLDQ
jgi:hypothetical protein